jgi:transcriptional regulator with XRE-family HTH domain
MTEARIKLVAMAAHAADDRPELSGDRPEDAVTTPQQDMNPLQRLIQNRLRDRGWSYGAVARRGGLPRSTVYTLATTRNLVRPPRPATIDALARGLDVPVSVVRSAAAESTGLHYYDETPAGQEGAGDRERDLLIASIDELSPDDRRHVAALVESLRNQAASPREPRLQARLPSALLRLRHSIGQLADTPSCSASSS